MKHLMFLLLPVFLLTSCASFEKEALYGHWKNEQWEMIFNADGTCKVGQGGQFLDGEWTYSTFGNTLELVRDGKVFLTNLTVKELTDQTLTLEFRDIGDIKIENTQVLQKQ